MSTTLSCQLSLSKINNRIIGIDLMRYLSVFAIIMIHTFATKELDYEIYFEDVIDQTCRFAVPFFFISGGFFLSGENNKNTQQKLMVVAKRTIPIFLFWTALYTLLIPSSIPSSISLRYLIILLATGGPAFHLWFLPSFGLCMALVIIAARYLRWGQMFATAAALYAIGLLIGSYNGLLSSTAHATVTGLYIARGGPFFGTIFVLFGLWLAKSGWRASMLQSASLVVLGLALHLTEAYLLDVGHLNYFAANDFLIGTSAFGAGVFLAALNIRSTSDMMRFTANLGKYTVGIYAAHLLFIAIFRSNSPDVGLAEKFGTAIAVLSASTLLSLMLARVRFMRLLVT